MPGGQEQGARLTEDVLRPGKSLRAGGSGVSPPRAPACGRWLSAATPPDSATAMRGPSCRTPLQADLQALLADVCDMDPVRVSADTNMVDAAVLMSDYNLLTIPVVDERRHVIGILTVDDVLEATMPGDWRRRGAALPADARAGDGP